MDARGLTPKETVPASRKLGREDAHALAAQASVVIVSKGKKITNFEVRGKPSSETVDAMLGPTGNLRAPTVRVGQTLLVGFNPEQYESVLSG